MSTTTKQFKALPRGIPKPEDRVKGFGAPLYPLYGYDHAPTYSPYTPLVAQSYGAAPIYSTAHLTSSTAAYAPTSIYSPATVTTGSLFGNSFGSYAPTSIYSPATVTTGSLFGSSYFGTPILSEAVKATEVVENSGSQEVVAPPAVEEEAAVPVNPPVLSAPTYIHSAPSYFAPSSYIHQPTFTYVLLIDGLHSASPSVEYFNQKFLKDPKVA